MIYDNNYNNHNNYNNPQIEVLNEANNLEANSKRERIVNKFFDELKVFEQKIDLRNKENIDKNNIELLTYTNLTQNYLEYLSDDEAIINVICEKIYSDTASYMESNNIEEKEVIKKGIQTACFCIYLCKEKLIDDYAASYIKTAIAINDTKELYTDFNNLFEYIGEKTKSLIKKFITSLDAIIPERRNNAEEIEKEILDNLEVFKISSDENDELDIIRTLYCQNIELLNTLKTYGIDERILNTIENNMASCRSKVKNSPYLKTQININMKLLYSFLYICIKNENKNKVTAFLNEISNHNIEALQHNINRIISLHDEENIIKTISEKILGNISENLDEVNNKLKEEILNNIKDMRRKSDENNKFDFIKGLGREITGVFHNSKFYDVYLSNKIEQCKGFYCNKISQNPSLQTPITVGLELLYALLYSYKKNSDIYPNIEFKELIENICKNSIEYFAYNFEKIFKPYDKKGFMESIKNELTKNIKKEELDPNYKENLKMNQDYLKNGINNIEKQNKNFKPNLGINYKNIKAVNQDEDLKIVENFKNKIWKKIPHTDITSLSNIKEIEETFDFYKGECMNIIFDSSLDEVTKEKLTEKILDIEFPQDDELKNSENNIMALNEKNEKEKDYTKKMNIMSLLLYIATKSENKRRNKKMLNFILKCDIENLYNYIDEIFKDFKEKTKEAIYKKYEITPQ